MEKRRAIGPSAWWLLAAGAAIGIIAAVLVKFGDPGNMGVCIACFLRDITGFFVGAVTNQGAVSYIRPEIIGIILGAAGSALAFKEFRPRGGSSVFVRFILGFIFVVAALIFLGCTVRAWLRLGGGDLNALWGILGIVVGVLIGVVFLKRGFSLKRAGVFKTSGSKLIGWILPVFAVILLIFGIMNATGNVPSWATQTKANAFATGDTPPVVFLKTDGRKGDVADILKPAGATLDAEGNAVAEDGSVVASAESLSKAKPQPGGQRAPFLISLIGGLLVGIIGQRSRFCTIGGIRDGVLVKRFDLLFGVFGLLVGATVMNLIFGNYNFGFENQPVAHVGFLGNFAPMVIAGLAAVLMGGCPFRQVIMGSEGDADATAAVTGMLVGAGVASFLGIVASAKGVPVNSWYAMAVCAVILLVIGVFYSRKSTS